MTILIVVSMFLIVGSAVALAFGWITAHEALIWTSIGATVVAAILLAIAYYWSIKVSKAPMTAADLPDDDEPAEPAEPVSGPDEAETPVDPGPDTATFQATEAIDDPN